MRKALEEFKNDSKINEPEGTFIPNITMNEESRLEHVPEITEETIVDKEQIVEEKCVLCENSTQHKCTICGEKVCNFHSQPDPWNGQSSPSKWSKM